MLAITDFARSGATIAADGTVEGYASLFGEIDQARDMVIPRMKHWEINAWYQTKAPSFGNMSPRDYLKGKDWDKRRKVGLEALIDAGVLKP